MKLEQVHEIVATTIRQHPQPCYFERDAVAKATRAAHARIAVEPTPDAERVIDILEEEIRAVELWCPFEGIDRIEERA